MPERMDRSTLLLRMQEAHARLETALAGVEDSRLTERGVTDEWSVRDLLNHLCFWEQRRLARLSLTVSQQPGPIDEAEMHRLNAESVAARRGLSPAAALAAHRQAYAELLASVSALGDDELNDTARFGPAGHPLWQHIAGDSYEHYEEHAAEIRAWLDRTTSGSSVPS